MTYSLRSLALVVSYYLCWQFSRHFEIAPDVSAFYPASGVLAFFLFRYGWRYLPAAVVAVLLGSFPQLPFWEWAAHNHLHLFRQIVVYGGGALLARQFDWLALPVTGLRDTLRLIAFAVLTALCSALVAIWIFHHHFPQLHGVLDAILFSFWVGDVSGILMFLGVASLVTDAFCRFHAPTETPLRLQYPAMLSLVASSVVVFAFIAFLGLQGELKDYGYLVLLPVIFGTAAFGLHYGILSAFIVNLSAVVAYVTFDFSQYPAIELQFLCATIMCLGMILGSSVDDRKKAIFDARHDELTGLLNRRALFDQGELMLERSRRYRRPLALVMLDVDHFKQVNDTHGHAVGDRLLKEVGRRCLQASRKTDLSARIGGEEFALLIDEADAEKALQFAERLRVEIHRIPFEEHDRPMSASFGISVASPGTPNLGTMLLEADQALYEAKRSGRNRSVLHSGQKGIVTPPVNA